MWYNGCILRKGEKHYGKLIWDHRRYGADGNRTVL